MIIQFPSQEGYEAFKTRVENRPCKLNLAMVMRWSERTLQTAETGLQRALLTAMDQTTKLITSLVRGNGELQLQLANWESIRRKTIFIYQQQVIQSFELLKKQSRLVQKCAEVCWGRLDCELIEYGPKKLDQRHFMNVFLGRLWEAWAKIEPDFRWTLEHPGDFSRLSTLSTNVSQIIDWLQKNLPKPLNAQAVIPKPAGNAQEKLRALYEKREKLNRALKLTHLSLKTLANLQMYRRSTLSVPDIDLTLKGTEANVVRIKKKCDAMPQQLTQEEINQLTYRAAQDIPTLFAQIDPTPWNNPITHNQEHWEKNQKFVEVLSKMIWRLKYWSLGISEPIPGDLTIASTGSSLFLKPSYDPTGASNGTAPAQQTCIRIPVKLSPPPKG